MQLSKESEYAVRCVHYMNVHADRTVMVSEIARGMKIPRSFLAKILQRLKAADIVVSYRGAKGGYRLARPGREIRLFDIVSAIERSVTVDPLCAVVSTKCPPKNRCALHPAWVEIRKELNRVLCATSIKDYKLPQAAMAELA